jgi:hypothetical protein
VASVREQVSAMGGAFEGLSDCVGIKVGCLNNEVNKFCCIFDVTTFVY